MSHNTAPGRLLVVDDNKVNRLLLGRGLEQQGHRVAFAENGRLALEMLHQAEFDLVLLDIQMPEMDGYQVLEKLTADLALRDIPVIVTSALEELDSVVRCIEMGAEDYLIKPVKPVLLKARIGASLEKSACATSSTSSSAALPPLKWPRTWKNLGSPWGDGLSKLPPCFLTSAALRPWLNRSLRRIRSSC